MPEAEPGVQMNIQLAAILLATDLFFVIIRCWSCWWRMVFYFYFGKNKTRMRERKDGPPCTTHHHLFWSMPRAAAGLLISVNDLSCRRSCGSSSGSTNVVSRSHELCGSQSAPDRIIIL